MSEQTTKPCPDCGKMAVQNGHREIVMCSHRRKDAQRLLCWWCTCGYQSPFKNEIGEHVFDLGYDTVKARWIKANVTEASDGSLLDR